MLPQNKPDRIRILFDDRRLAANAGLLLPAALARHLGLRELVDRHLDLGCARAGPTPPVAPPTSCVRRWAGALRRGQGTTHGAGRQRLLRPHCRCRLPGNGCPLLYHHPPARQPAGPDRGDTRGGLDSHSLLDGRRRRCRRDDLHPVPDQAGRRARCGSLSGGEADARFPARPLRQIQLLGSGGSW